MPIDLFDCRVGQSGQAAAVAALASGQIAAGSNVTALEHAMSGLLPERQGVAIQNMTQALEIALTLSGVGTDDDVLTLAFNCLASNSAIHNIGARPVWIDLEPATATMAVEDARAQITPKTKAVVVYHIAGYPAPMSALRQLCDEFGLVLIEDANAAFGARLPCGAPVGSIGDFAVFSFYANRLINGAEGAILMCPNAAVAAQARRHRRFGIDQASFRDARGEINPQSDVAQIGIAATMNNVNAGIAMASLETAQSRLSTIRQNAAALSDGLASIPGITTVAPLPGAEPSYWVFMILTDRRDDVLDILRERGIGRTKLHQPNQFYSGFGGVKRSLPGTDSFSSRMVGLPIGWWIGEKQIGEILEVLAVA